MTQSVQQRGPRLATMLQKLLPRRIRELPIMRGVGLVWALAFLVLFGCTAVFAKIAAEMLQGETQTLDESVLHAIHRYASPQLDAIAVEITALGDDSVLVVIMLVASALLWAMQHRFAVVQLWVAVIGGMILTPLLKLAFQRPRPSLFEVRAHYSVSSPSFPSGHAMNSLIAYVTLAYIIARLQPTPGLRRTTFALATIAIVLIGWSRMYLGVHYPSDVMAGYTIGLAWATLCAIAVEALRVRAARRSNGATTGP